MLGNMHISPAYDHDQLFLVLVGGGGGGRGDLALKIMAWARICRHVR